MARNVDDIEQTRDNRPTPRPSRPLPEQGPQKPDHERQKTVDNRPTNRPKR